MEKGRTWEGCQGGPSISPGRLLSGGRQGEEGGCSGALLGEHRCLQEGALEGHAPLKCLSEPGRQPGCVKPRALISGWLSALGVDWA